jgi:hypothetical protein
MPDERTDNRRLENYPRIRCFASALGAIIVAVLLQTGQALAYRPFDSTDAAVAELADLEFELGPLGYRKSQEDRTLVAPSLVVNYGFAKDWEAVLEGSWRTSAGSDRRCPQQNAFSLKQILREGVLQDTSGPSVATEFGVLLPGLRDEQGYGASWVGIVSDRFDRGTTHFNFGAELTRDHNPNFVTGWIVEGPHEWTIRPVAEARFEHQIGAIKMDTVSALIGAIWKVRDDLSVDFAVRHGWVNGIPETEVRAGLTFAFSLVKTTSQAVNR